MKKKVTMQDIADRLNISRNSVSRALSQKSGVSIETRKQVEAIADEMGYNYAVNRKKPIHTVGGNIVLVSSDHALHEKGFFGGLFSSIRTEAAKHGLNLIIQSVDQHARDNLILPSTLEDNLIEGILILSHISTEYINRIINTGIPIVLIDHHHPFNQADSVLQNNRFAAYIAVHHLIELGHKKIGFIGHTRRSPSYQERFEGFNLAIRDYNLFDERFILCDIHEDENSVAGSLKGLPEQPTAWFCVNDGFGFFTLSTLQTMGYAIPDDISVCSFDNGILSRLSNPKTTTVNVDLNLYGRKAVEQLIWRMHNPSEPVQELLLPASLINRESTSPPKKS